MINLVVGQSYYLVGFYDAEFSLPCISTVIYEGLDNDNNLCHIFKVVADGSFVSYEEANIDNIVDKANLIAWLQREHAPEIVGEKYQYIREF